MAGSEEIKAHIRETIEHIDKAHGLVMLVIEDLEFLRGHHVQLYNKLGEIATIALSALPAAAEEVIDIWTMQHARVGRVQERIPPIKESCTAAVDTLTATAVNAASKSWVAHDYLAQSVYHIEQAERDLITAEAAYAGAVNHPAQNLAIEDLSTAFAMLNAATIELAALGIQLNMAKTALKQYLSRL